MNEAYESFEYIKRKIPKKNGQIRTIYMPNNHLKIVQRYIHNVLSDNRPHRKVFSYRKNINCAEHAAYHKGQLCAITVDIKDFFHMFHINWVRAFFKVHPILSKRADYYAAAATTAIEGYRGFRLPQGSCCSPVISNLIFRAFDDRLNALAERNGGRYSRYADDITISFCYEPSGARIRSIINQIKRILFDAKMEINTSKTRIQYAPDIWITGVKVV